MFSAARCLIACGMCKRGYDKYVKERFVFCPPPSGAFSDFGLKHCLNFLWRFKGTTRPLRISNLFCLFSRKVKNCLQLSDIQAILQSFSFIVSAKHLRPDRTFRCPRVRADSFPKLEFELCLVMIVTLSWVSLRSFGWGGCFLAHNKYKFNLYMSPLENVALIWLDIDLWLALYQWA